MPAVGDHPREPFSEQVRAHGVTPVLSQGYAQRSARQQAAFILPFLTTGLELLDVGCGPGSITLGLARSVAPGRVVGIDHDGEHVSQARALAAETGVDNAGFEVGDALALPIEDDRFDVAFENDLFVHLASRAPDAALEIRRVLKPGGLFAARDAVADAALWGNGSAGIGEFDRLFFRWQAARGSDISLGRQLPGILEGAGFETIAISVSADTRATRAEVDEHAGTMLSLLGGPVGRDARSRGDLDENGFERMAAAIRTWAGQPGSFFANVHVEVVGRKPR
jgi:SAM-dependent methyltransferase